MNKSFFLYRRKNRNKTWVIRDFGDVILYDMIMSCQSDKIQINKHTEAYVITRSVDLEGLGLVVSKASLDSTLV